jgi:cysteine desulfurase
MRTIYLDNAAATPIGPKVKKEMIRAMNIYGNPSSYNDAGREAAKELSGARTKVARFLGAHTEEVVFTGSGSEANSMAIAGLTSVVSKNKKEIITTPIEHHSVLEPIRYLNSEEFKIIFAKVDRYGFVDTNDLAFKINSKTLLVSVMYANNEIGTIEPINKIGKTIESFKKMGRGFPLFHVDACQAVGCLNMNVNSLGADLVTFNGSKIGGPRGIGVLYVKNGTELAPFVLGGGQERGLRAGTENLPAILGLAKAIEVIDKKESARLTKLRDYFIDKIKGTNKDIKLNGPEGKDRLPNNINISILGLDSENLLLELDKHGIHAGSGSACTSRAVEPSHVLKAIGTDRKYLSGALRFSMGKETTKRDLDYVLKVLPKMIFDLKKRYGK